MPTSAPYGSWSSPISSHHLGEKTTKFGYLHVEGKSFYYTESRPFEKGRSALMQGFLSKEEKELLPSSYNVKTRVNEYGGKCFTVQDTSVYLFNDVDGALYVLKHGKSPKKIFQRQGLAFVDLVIDRDLRFLYAIAEEKKEKTSLSSIVKLCLETKQIEIIHQGYDFYACVRISPDSKQLAWISWNHPNMPWDTSDLWIATLDENGSVLSSRRLVNSHEESISHLFWSEDSSLYFTSDLSGYWNLYRYSQDNIESMYPSEIEFGSAHWVFGTSRFAFISKDTLAMIGTEEGIDGLYILNTTTKKIKKLQSPYTSLSELYAIEDSLIFIGTSPFEASAIVSLDITKEQLTLLKKSTSLNLDPLLISKPKKISIPIEDGKYCYAFYYPPTNPFYEGPEKSAPPLILKIHSGPTTHTPPKFNLETLYFTSRGFAVAELNYRGSTGYGKKYRQALNGNWGVIDSQDVIATANYLCKEGLSCKDKLILKGSSAGGYTTLRTLTLTNLFKVGVSYYGISDLELLAKETHKFELHYLDHLVGPYPKEKTLYKVRSPIYSAEKITSALLFFQGEKDLVVATSQTLALFDVLKKRSVPVSCLLFKEEGHGFKIDDTIIKCVEAELYFYSQIFCFPLSEEISPIQIENLSKSHTLLH